MLLSRGPKLDAAVALDIPVVMVQRPALPPGLTAVGTVQEAADWVARNARREGLSGPVVVFGVG